MPSIEASADPEALQGAHPEAHPGTHPGPFPGAVTAAAALDPRAPLPPVLVLGANGRLGRMLRQHWPAAWPVAWGIRGGIRGEIREKIRGGMRAQSQEPAAGGAGGTTLHCDPLGAPESLTAALSGRQVVLSLAGAAPRNTPRSTPHNTPGSTENAAARLAEHAALARALTTATEAAGLPLLLASSAAVYGRPAPDTTTGATPDAPLAEDMPLSTEASPYGQAKREMEHVALAGSTPGSTPDSTPGRVCCLRIGNVAGADALLGGLNETTTPPTARPTIPPVLDVFSAPSGEHQGAHQGPLRSYIGPETLARVLAALVARAGLRDTAGLPPRLNIAAPGAVDMAALLRAAGQPFTPRPAPPEALGRVVLDTARLAALVPLDPAAGQPARLVAEWRAAFDIDRGA